MDQQFLRKKPATMKCKWSRAVVKQEISDDDYAWFFAVGEKSHTCSGR